MRIVVRTYVDGRTKPHHDEYKTDCYDEVSLRDALEDIEGQLLKNLEEIEDLVVEEVDS